MLASAEPKGELMATPFTVMTLQKGGPVAKNVRAPLFIVLRKVAEAIFSV